MRNIGDKYQGEIKKIDGTMLPEGEPLFLLRAKDKCAMAALKAYVTECQAQGSPPDQVESVNKQIQNFRDWQNQNPDTVKVSD